MMRRFFLLAVAAIAFACVGASPLQAQQTEPRIAIVIGNSAYAPGALPTALNDAGLVAETLRSIGFEVVEGGDLGQPDLVRSYREFLGKVQASGPDTLAFVYFSGLAVSFEGENFLLGVDARLQRDSDIPIQGVRLSDLLRPLADTPARAKVMMIDAARGLPFRPQGRGMAPGLEAVEPPQGMLIAFSSAPGTIAPDRPGNYGAYATAIAEMLRAPGTDIDVAFTHIRSRTHLATQGQQTPWHQSAIGEQIELVPPEAATASLMAPPPPRPARPMREVDPDEAYALAIEMDTLDGYVGFVDAYPRHPYSERVWAIIRARREALAWMRALQINSPQAYWTYLRRYPNGIYAYDAERRLRRLGAPFDPPLGFAMLEFDGVPMALLDEPREYREVYRVGPPPPRFLYRSPPPAYLVSLPPPRRSAPGIRVLPALGTTLIPAVARLAPAPRRDGPPGAGRPGGYGERRGFAARPPGGASGPAALPNTAIAPSTVSPSPGSGLRPGGSPPAGSAPGTAAPSTAVAPSTVTPGPPSRQGPRDRPPGWGPAPGAATPNTAVAPSAVTPNTASPPAAPGGRRDFRPPPGGPPPGSASRTPPNTVAPSTAVPSTAAPSTAAPSTAAPSTALPAPSAPGTARDRRDFRPPPGGPPPGTASRTPPSQQPPPPAAVARPTPPQQPVVRQPPPPPQPVIRQASPPPPRQAAPPPPPPPRQAAPPPPPRQAAPAPPPPRPAAAAPAKPPQCPAGKTFKNGACS